MSTPEPIVTATRYEVSCLPPHHGLYRQSIVVVERRGLGHHDRWSVGLDGWVYDRDGEPSLEPRPSERTSEWLERYRHDLDTATSIAQQVARTVAADLTGGAR